MALEGIEEYLIGSGFEIKTLPHQDGREEFYIYTENNVTALQVSKSSLIK